MANYNKDTDYTKLIEQAVKSGNYGGAALLEQQRNQKIADMGLNYEQTNQYSQYLPQNATNPYGGSAESVYTHNASQGDAKGSMNQNSAQWWAAKGMGDTDMMKSLEAANQQLASLLGGGIQFNGAAGTWSGVADMPATTQASMNTGVNPVRPEYDYNAWAAENPAPTYQSAYNAQIDALMNGLLNREKFSYDAESDPLFQQYRDIYTREGNRSMNDTLAAAASGAGGMSSYAMTAAQQANNYYMAQLGDKVPELQQLAYEMYLDDMNLQRQDINMLMDRDSMEYNRYRDSVNDWQTDRNFGYNMYRDQMGDYQWGTEFNYGASRDQIADQRYDQEWQYQLDRDKIADQRYDTEWQYGVSRDQIADQRYDQEWQYGLTRDQIEDAWRQMQWDYNVGRDQIADQRYQQEWEYETSLGNLGFTGDQPSDAPSDQPSDNPNDKPTTPKTEEEKRYENSKLAMGIGMIRDSLVTDAILAGGIIENDDGSIAWAPGWNKDNWQKKLSLIQSGSNPNLINMW